MSERELNLDGGEITLIKALGLSGTEVSGEELMKRCADLAPAELIDTLEGLIMVGYVECDGNSMHDLETFKRFTIRVNPGYAKDLRDALNPQHSRPKSKRVRRE